MRFLVSISDKGVHLAFSNDTVMSQEMQIDRLAWPIAGEALRRTSFIANSKLNSMDSLGKMLMGLGAVIFLFGLIIAVANKLGWLRLGRLPGDISIQREGFNFYFPLATCLILSLVGTLVMWLIGALKR